MHTREFAVGIEPGRHAVALPGGAQARQPLAHAQVQVGRAGPAIAKVIGYRQGENAQAILDKGQVAEDIRLARDKVEAAFEKEILRPGANDRIDELDIGEQLREIIVELGQEAAGVGGPPRQEAGEISAPVAEPHRAGERPHALVLAVAPDPPPPDR